jgi:hypothetical protein
MPGGGGAASCPGGATCPWGCSYLPVLSKTGTSLYGTVTRLIKVLTELTVAVINH